MPVPELVTAPTRDSSAVPAAQQRARGRTLRLAVRMLQVRLRFVVVFLVAFFVVGKWNVLSNYWDSMTRYVAGRDVTEHAVSLDTEYFCPMDPGVVSDWPGKCGICNMALVRRKKGEAVALPDGVMRRMQLSPYRLQLAGVQTSQAVFRPLAREIASVGVVVPAAAAIELAPRTRIEPLEDSIAQHAELAADSQAQAFVAAELFESDLPFVVEGRAAIVASDVLPGRPSFEGTVVHVSPELDARTHMLGVQIRLSDSAGLLRPGMTVRVRIMVPICEIEPFRSMPRSPPKLRASDPREAFRCPEHSDVLRLSPGTCPQDKNELERFALDETQRIQWWCPMHTGVSASEADHECAQCSGMKLVPRIISYLPAGQVLTVPESAVIDTGLNKLLYVDRGSGMFDGVEVTLGPRCGSFFPVIRGLESGQRVVTTGAFLIDAETRLNPAVAASYFGAIGNAPSGGTDSPQRSASEPSATTVAETRSPDAEQTSFDAVKALASLAAADRELATRQRVCPVTGQKLGSMGVPFKMAVAGRTVFLCCEGCASELRENPEKYLRTLR